MVRPACPSRSRQPARRRRRRQRLTGLVLRPAPCPPAGGGGRPRLDRVPLPLPGEAAAGPGHGPGALRPRTAPRPHEGSHTLNRVPQSTNARSFPLSPFSPQHPASRPAPPTAQNRDPIAFPMNLGVLVVKSTDVGIKLAAEWAQAVQGDKGKSADDAFNDLLRKARRCLLFSSPLHLCRSQWCACAPSRLKPDPAAPALTALCSRPRERAPRPTWTPSSPSPAARGPSRGCRTSSRGTRPG